MVGLGPKSRPTAARAYAPAHLTGFFVPEHSGRDPRARGSLGAGLVLDRGVRASATIEGGGPKRLRFRTTPRTATTISRDAAGRLRAGTPGSLRVELLHELPIGQGLGMSAAGALATSLAVARLVGTSRLRAAEVAHLAELTHRGGLGGVAAILDGGGLECRRTPGVPPFGRVTHRPARARLLLLTVGPPIPSQAVLSDAPRIARLRRAGRAALRRYLRGPGLDRFFVESERFTDEVDLADARLRNELDRWRSAGWYAAQAMFGRVVFAMPRTGRLDAEALRNAPRVPGVRRTVVAIGTRGAGWVPE